MNFFPMGPLMRRAGVFFIRRSFKDNDVYKFVLRQYIDYLIEKRFPLEWYIEGGRSRSGKLLPPRFGLLAYVVDSYRRGRADDVTLIPVSIAYDQISDVQDYAREQLGGAKHRESFGCWSRGSAGCADPTARSTSTSASRSRSPRRSAAEPRGEARSRRGQPRAPEARLRGLRADQRGHAITPVSLVTLALLGTGGVAQTVPGRDAAPLEPAHRRRAPRPAEHRPHRARDTRGCRAVLDALAANEVVDRFAEGSEPVYRIGVQRELAAAYYRNSVNPLLCRPRDRGGGAARGRRGARARDRVAAFWRAAMQLRDLLKFEFFFPDRDAFAASCAAISRARPELGGAARAQRRRRARAGEALAPVQRPPRTAAVIEAYRVVADRLAQTPPETVIDKRGFVDACLGLGRQYHLQRRIHSGESVSQVLFEAALKVADNRGLVSSTEPIS